MDAFLISVAAVALAEIGDKTQLLCLLLAARFRKPLPIIAGILTATLVNHALAGLIGESAKRVLGLDTLRWLIGISFLIMAAWTLKPDKLDDPQTKQSQGNIFSIAFVAFFLAEMGDKTQIATALLAAKYQALPQVVGGTTLGMMLADVPAVLLGNAAAEKIPFRMVRYAAAGLFAVLGIAALVGIGE